MQRSTVRASRGKAPTEPGPEATEPTRAAAPFLIAISLAAFLLFSLELLAGRLVLPVFGGAPAVWTTSLCFFTAALFLGYLYAHLVATKLSLRTGSIIQAALAVAVIVLTAAAPARVASLRQPGMPEALNVLVALLLVSGPAAFLLASTTPLLSAWYASGRDAPWWLYAASNAASFAALVAYPFVIAPAVLLSTQRSILVVALVAYAAALAWTIARVRSSNVPVRPVAVVSHEPLTYRRQAVWLLAAAVPAGLMAATTNFITTDLVAAPLIWVGPLGVYLASFVVAFSTRGRRLVHAAGRLAPVAATMLWLPFMQPVWCPVVPLLATELAALFLLAVAIHGGLALDRPAEVHLTRFYLVISLGGLLGTAFVALVAPAVFSLIYEYPLLIAAGMVVLVLLPGPPLPPGLRILGHPRRLLVDFVWRLVPYAVAAGLLFMAVSSDGVGAETDQLGKLILFGAAVVAVSITPQVSSIATLAAIEFLIVLNGTSPLHRQRTFFGVLQVVASSHVHTEYSGTTLHGLQFTDERSREPTAYYVKTGPVGAIFDDLRGRAGKAAIGVVGLGVGTIAAYARPNDQWVFYEIDSAVIDIARNPAYFTYLEDAAVVPRIVAGDGRLSLAAEPPASFDLLVLDAFASDVVPAHLLTREAMAIYLRALRPGGVLVFNLSSRFYHLAEPVGATARSLGLAAAGRSLLTDEAMDQAGMRPSLWVVAGGAADVARFTARGWVPVPFGGAVLTDDYSDLTRLLFWGGSSLLDSEVSGDP